MPPNHEPRPTPRSNPQIDAGQYQILYALEMRMDERFDRARVQHKEDIAAVVAPIIARLEDGNRRFASLEEGIRFAKESAAKHADDCPLTKKRSPKEETSSTTKKKGMPWWLPLLVGGALAFVGERASRAVINALADPPPAPAVKTP